MSKKCLARTVIEGGRTGVYKEVVRQQKKTERSRFRTYCRNVVVDPESAYDRIPIVEPPDNYQFDNKFKDKLSPMYGWLFAQIGKPWNEAYSEIRRKFDTRTTAGRHVVFDHLIFQVNTTGDPLNDYRDFDIDAAGILILTEHGKRTYLRGTGHQFNHKAAKKREAEFQLMANDRFVIDRGAAQFWRCKTTLRQLERLTDNEAAAWRALGEDQKWFIFVPPSKMDGDLFGGWLARLKKPKF